MTKLRSFISNHKALSTVLIAIVLLTAAAGAALFSRLQTMSNIEKFSDELYSVDYTVDYHLDDLLAQGVSNIGELTAFLSKEIFFGYPIDVKENLFECSVFTAKSPAGKRLVGRNFDYAESATLVVYTAPKRGYRSYSGVNLAHLGLTKEDGNLPDTIKGKLTVLASPYLCADGLNEKGLCVAVLELDGKPTNQASGKKNIVTTVAVRMLLDKCASVDEAVRMLNEFDMRSSAGVPYHFFLVDRTGKSAVVEWDKSGVTATATRCATNFSLAKGAGYWYGSGHDRYATITRNLARTESVLTPEGAMSLLSDARVKWDGEWGTQWSMVYNLDDFSFDLCIDMDYAKVYRFAK